MAPDHPSTGRRGRRTFVTRQTRDEGTRPEHATGRIPGLLGHAAHEIAVLVEAPQECRRFLDVGLGPTGPIADAELTWPSGLVQDVTVAVGAGGTVTLHEPRWLEIMPRVVPAGGGGAACPQTRGNDIFPSTNAATP